MKNHVEVVIDYINNSPLPVEAAAVERKGKVHAAPLFVSYCSNYATGRIQNYCADPLPFYRRFPFRVCVVPKREFSTPAGAIDLEKARAAKTHDMWNLQV